MTWKKTEHFKETEFGPMKTGHTVEQTDCPNCEKLSFAYKSACEMRDEYLSRLQEKCDDVLALIEENKRLKREVEDSMRADYWAEKYKELLRSKQESKE